LAVTVAVARPEESVTALATTMLAPKDGPENVTVTPGTGLLNLSVTVATSGDANGVPTDALWLLPLIAATEAGAPAALDIEKAAGIETPVTFAVTEYPPAVVLAVKTGDVAIPDALVVAVAVTPPPAKVPLGPVPGAVNVTLTPLKGLPPASFTVAASGEAKTVPTCTLCPLPPVGVTDAGGPAVLVSE
jgi:hypothetical protein